LNIPRPYRNEMNTNLNNNFVIENHEVIPSSHQRNQFQPLDVISQLFNPSTGGLYPMQMMQQTSFSPFSTSVSTSTVYDPVRGMRITTINNNGEISVIRHDLNGRIIPEISEETLNNFPERVITKADLNNTVNAQKECVICLNNFEENENVITLPCLHIFHSKCIKDWLRNGSPECPICKTTVNSN
jgi:hypothetical protein